MSAAVMNGCLPAASARGCRIAAVLYGFVVLVVADLG